MLRTDTIGRVWHVRNVCLLFFLSFFGIQIFANSNPDLGSIVCNNQVNVSLHEIDCTAEITPDMIVEGTIDPLYDYTLAVAGPLPSTAEVPLDPVSGFPVITEKGDYTVTVTQTGNDASNLGQTNSCWGNILVEDKADPVITDTDTTTPGDQTVCPHETPATALDLELFCTEIEQLRLGFYTVPAPAASDACSGTDLTTSFTDTYHMFPYDPSNPTPDVSDMCTQYYIERVYTFDDQCGNKVTSCSYWYLINPISIDNTTPVVWPSRATVPCGTGTSPAELFDYFYQLNYDQLVQNLLDALQLIDPQATIADIDPADLVAADESATATALTFSYPTLLGTVLDEGTYCNIAVVYEDELIPVCGAACTFSDKILRVWKIYNWCVGGEVIEHTQIIEAFDTDGPIIQAEDFIVSTDPWGCYGDFYMPEPTVLKDLCSDFVSYTVTGPFGANVVYEQGAGWHVTNAPKGTYTYTYTAFDCCENATEYDITVTVVDNTQPIAIAKQDIVISLVNVDSASDDGQGIAKLFAQSLDNGSFDGCGPVRLEVRRDSDFCNRSGNLTFNNDVDHSFDSVDDVEDQGHFVTFCCSDISDNGVDEDGDGINDYALVKVWLRVWDDGDMDGVYGTDGDNYNEAWGYVRVEDKAQPELLCPEDITISCADDYHDLDVVGSAQAINACGSATVDYLDEKDLDGCGAGTILRTWFVVGYPDINCTQEITSDPSNSGTVLIYWPEDITTDCTDDLSDEIPTWTTDNPCDLIAYTVDVDTFYFEEGSCYKIVKHWTIVNWCDRDPFNGTWNHTQEIKILDNEKPYFTECEDVTLPADDFSDLDQDGIVCENNMVMLTAAADDVGTCASPWIKWNIEVDLNSDNWIDFVFSSNLPTSDPYYVAPTLAGSQVKITLPEGVRGSMDTHSVKWKASDGCGNTATCNSTFMVVDQKPPTPYCVNLSTALMDNGQVELWACDFDLGSFDNCTTRSNLRYTFTDTPPADDPNYNETTRCSARVFTCDDALNANPFPVSLYVWDEKDNYDFCIVTLTLVDNQGSCGGSGTRADISGSVFTEEGRDVSDVMVSLNSALPESPNQDMTDDQGGYLFEDRTMYVDYTIGGSKDGDYLNGVSTLDLVLIQRHVLGVTYLESPYKLIAADVNADEKVSTIDLIELRKLILGIYDELPDNKSWRFVPEAENLDASNPWPFTEEINIDELDHSMFNENLIGIKIGDVNSSVELGLNDNDTESRSNDKITLSIEDEIVSAGDVVTVDFNSVDFQEIYGYQFTMNTAGLELIDVSSDAIELSTNNVATFNNAITMSWNTLKASSVDNVLFTMTFKANQSGSIAEMLSLNSSITNAEAYKGDGLEKIALELRTGTEEGYQLFQNVPNPFSNVTTIGFELPVDGPATINIYDLNGKLLNQVSGSFNKGYNQVEVNADALNQTGILYYELQSGNFSATMKMIIIN